MKVERVRAAGGQSEALTRLKFFRDLNTAERMKVYAVFGIPDDAIAEVTSHATERLLFKRLFASLTTARTDGIEVERLRDTLELHQTWLRAALDCKDWTWDGDQRQAAEEAYAQGQAALFPPANEPAKDERRT